MATSEPVLSEWNEEDRLSGRNFTCQRCSQRFNERHLVWQDGLYMCDVQCYEPNGGSIDRDLERARAAELAADLSTKELRPPKQAGWTDTNGLYAITDFSARPIVVTAGGATGSLTITGVGLTASDTATFSGSGVTATVGSVAADGTSAVLTITAAGGAAKTLRSMTYNDEVFQNVVDVR